jgi:hypothetical protein
MWYLLKKLPNGRAPMSNSLATTIPFALKAVIGSAFAVSFLITVSATVAQEQGVSNLKVETKQIKKEKEDEQIDLNQKGETKNGITILDAGGRAGVAMSCYTTEGGHRIGIYVNNTNNTPRRCQSYCYYRTSNGYEGVHRCNAVIRGRFNGEFCSDLENSFTFTVTNPGAFDCSL